jgi:ABC-type lipoprotein export system ATPase subunit
MKYIKSIEIIGSPFYKNNFKIEFDKKLNCIMGGRGTGKTTLLYFIASALNKNIEENKMAYSILKNNLYTGEVILEIENEDDVTYKISKFINDEPQPSNFSTGEFISIDRILNEIQCDIYEASTIEEIGRNGEGRLKLINKMLQEEVNYLLNDIGNLRIDLNDNFTEIRSLGQRLKQREGKIQQLTNIEDELRQHRANQPKDINVEEDKEFNLADLNEKKRISEERYIKKCQELYNEINRKLVGLNEDIEDFQSNKIVVNDVFANHELMTKITEEIDKSLKAVNTYIKQIANKLDTSEVVINALKVELTKIHEKQQSEFVRLKQKIQTNKEYYTKLNELTKKDNERKDLLKDFKDSKRKFDRLKSNRETLMNQLNEKKQLIYNKRLEKIKKLNDTLGEEIKVNLTFGGITDEYELLLKESLKGSGLRYNELVPRIVKKFSPDRFAKIINNKDENSLKTIDGIDEVRANTLIQKLYESDEIYDIETIYCQDLPDFYLRIEKGSNIEQENYQKSDDLSTGQRCTAVLPIIFAVSQNPLIVDQPEDNLDNKYITQNIFKIIREQKLKRQLIFITHNPNIPVLSDSEQNIFLRYDLGSHIDTYGTIESVKNNILELLEGGKEAFNTRKELYEKGIINE